MESNDKPGLGGIEFTLDLKEWTFPDGMKLVIGEDIEFVDKPYPFEDGWKYSFKAISQKALNYFKNGK